MNGIKKGIFLSIIFILIGYCQPSMADWPYISDDATPTAYRTWDVYVFSYYYQYPQVDGAYIFVPSVELDYGLFRNFNLHLILPVVTAIPNPGKATTGFGDIETGFKYRFFDETKYLPAMAFEPYFELPTGKARRNLGNGRCWTLLPIWLEKNIDKWSLYGGGGYALNSAQGQRNYWFGGLVVEKEISKKLTLGVELYSEGPVSVTIDTSTTLTLGAIYSIKDNFSFLCSLGHNIYGAQQWVGFIGLYWNIDCSNKNKNKK